MRYYTKQELLTIREHLSSSMMFLVRSALLIFLVLRLKRLYLQLFIEGLMSYLRYLCLLAHSGVQHILCCVFVLFFFGFCALCCQFLWIVHSYVASFSGLSTPMLPVSLDCPLLITPSVFSYVYFHFFSVKFDSLSFS